MKYSFPIINKLTKKEFYKIKEDDIIFITNPGRMVDEDGSTFIVKKDNSYVIYRVSGWYMSDRNNPDFISFTEMLEKFPKWNNAIGNEDNDPNYKYVYMGFGNGLCIKKEIYDKYLPYLDDEIDKYIKKKNYNEEEKSGKKYEIIFNTWDKAVVKMADANNIYFK